MAYSQEWLEDIEALRGIFVEVYVDKEGVETPLYLSNIGYLTQDSSISFLPIITTSMSTTESLALDGSLTMSFGDIEINNFSGEYDSWLNSDIYTWVNREIRVYIGDPRWASATIEVFKSTFELIFTGVVSDIDSKGRDTINLKIRDKLEKLNTPLSEEVLGEYGSWSGGQNNQDTLKPLVFGEVFNMSPLLIDPATQEYYINNGNTEMLIELRDNGVPIYTNNGTTETLPMVSTGSISLATGKIKLGRALAGSLTASLQGIKGAVDLVTGVYSDNVYKNTVANLIAIITTKYGKDTKLSIADIDLPNFKSFDDNNQQPVGILIDSKTNLLQVCQDIASSLGAQVFMNRKGLLQLIRVGTASTTNIVIDTISDNDILHHSLAVSSKSTVSAATKIGYCKNWTTQEGLQTGIPDSHKLFFSTETVPTTIVDDSIKTLYRLSAEPEEKVTYLLNVLDASAEATRLNDFNKVPRITYKFTGTSKLFSLILGQFVTLTHNRFNLQNGKIVQVISLSPNWSSGTIEVEVLL